MNPDEELPPEVAPRGYYNQPVWKRIVVIGAGPAVNLVIAFVILFFLAFGVAEPTNDRRERQRGHARRGDARARRRARLGRRRQRGDLDGSCADQIATHECAGDAGDGCRADDAGARSSWSATASEVTVSRPARATTPRPSAPLLGFAYGTRRSTRGPPGPPNGRWTGCGT